LRFFAPNFVFPADFQPAEFVFGGFSVGPNFSVAAAKFGGCLML